MVDSVPAELLELQARFETWRANRQYVREPVPDELRSAALEMLRSYPPSLVHRVLKLDPSRLKKKKPAKRPTPKAAAPNKKSTPTRHIRPVAPKQKSKSSARAQSALSTSDHFLFVLRRLDRRLPRELSKLARLFPIDFPSTVLLRTLAARD
jgi:hypothetical protein